MPTFVPVYRPTKGQDTLLARQRRLAARKRRHVQDSSDSNSDSDAPNHADLSHGTAQIAAAQPNRPLPVSRTDPYHIAGHSREAPLPPAPFPHAAARDAANNNAPQPRRSRRALAPVETELAALKPPLYALRPGPGSAAAAATSLRRRHLDNIAAILHRSLLRGDDARAARAWALLVRTEVAGLGVDVRRNGRWGIGAELLMRRGGGGGTGGPEGYPFFSDRGFELAREYYERLILQHPHTSRTQHGFNATRVYPMLFNIWIYQVQEQSQRARQALGRRRRRGSSSDSSDVGAQPVQDGHDNDEEHLDYPDRVDPTEQDDAEPEREYRAVRARELQGAQEIVQRLDELLLSPPYDADAGLRRLRHMLELWMADLHLALARGNGGPGGGGGDPHAPVADYLAGVAESERHRELAEQCRTRAREMMLRLQESGAAGV